MKTSKYVMQRMVLISLLFLILPAFVYAKTIDAIKVDGLKRMKLDVFLKSLPVEEGDVFDDKTEEDIRIALVKTNLFSNIEVSTEESENDLVYVSIIVEEKWTLIPLPFFMYSNGSLSGGLFFLETNFLGRKQVLVSGFTYIKEKTFGLLTYSNPDIGIGGLGSGLSFVYNDTSDGPGSVAFAGGISKEIQPRLKLNSRLRFSLGRESSFIDGGSFISQLSLPLTLHYDGTIPRNAFYDGLMASFEYDPGYTITRETLTQAAKTSAQYGWIMAEKHQIDVHAAAEFEVNDPVFAGDWGGSRGERTLPRSEVFTGSIVSVDLSYQYAFWSNKALIVTATGFIEGGLFNKNTFPDMSAFNRFMFDDTEYHPYYGLGGGMRVYVRKVAIPAMGLDFGYNIPDEDIRVSFSIGVAM